MDASEFKKIFLPCHKKMYRVAFSILNNSQDAEDIVQEAYLKLWKKRDELTCINSPEAFCVILVRNLCMDFIRSNHSSDEDSIDDELSDINKVTKCLDNNEDVMISIENRSDARMLRHLINQLPCTQKTVIWLRDINDCSFDEIEKATGLSSVNIRATLSKARKKVREQFYNIVRR